MKVICAGVPKSGTKSITKALHHPGFTAFHWEEQIFDCSGFRSGDVFEIGIYQNADSCHPAIVFYVEILEAFPACR